MKQFSHSKLETYKRCPLQYKFQYLTSLKPEGEETIEAFVGSQVHSVLELLYRDLLKTKLNSLDDLIEFYDEIWRVGWKDSIVINKKEYNKEHSGEEKVKKLVLPAREGWGIMTNFYQINFKKLI